MNIEILKEGIEKVSSKIEGCNPILLESIKSFVEKVSQYQDPSLEVVLPDAIKSINNILVADKLWESDLPMQSTTLSIYIDHLTDALGVWHQSVKEKQWKKANLYFEKVKELVNEIEYD